MLENPKASVNTLKYALYFYFVGQTLYLKRTQFYLPFRNGLNNPNKLKFHQLFLTGNTPFSTRLTSPIV